MCGIFGLVLHRAHVLPASQVERALHHLFLASESRGKDASGLCVMDAAHITLLKAPVRGRALLKSSGYARAMQQLRAANADAPLLVMGHTRMVTNGDANDDANNQPVWRDHSVAIHNGIIVNDAHLWQQHPDLIRCAEVDTEVMLALYEAERNTQIHAFSQTFAALKGANSIAMLDAERDGLMLATSNGSLYTVLLENNVLAFASERNILEALVTNHLQAFGKADIMQLEPAHGLLCALDGSQLRVQPMSESAASLPKLAKARRVVQLDAGIKAPNAKLVHYQAKGHEALVQIDADAIANLKRCTQCLLPETFPFIQFDAAGVCSVCHGWQPLPNYGTEKLCSLVAPYRRSNGETECLVPLSGGRDSCYGLHYVVRELGLKPVAYTYDWGLITDLARRNISRMCGELGVEHILVSADIATKRAHVRRNVLAWLKKPHLGMVPLFMAGDKQFFYFAHMLKKQLDVELVLFGMNKLERTDFKTGFCAIREQFSDTKNHFEPSAKGKFDILAFYAKQYLSNRGYWNASVPDTLFAYFSYYLLPKRYHTLYDYLPWNEATVTDTIIQKYGWETAPDTTTTWRIGDGTAAFYNYIYLRVAGFCENETFRSNQIRAGLITREEAWKKVQEENQPRISAIEWYCKVIGLDFESTIRAINAISPLYATNRNDTV